MIPWNTEQIGSLKGKKYHNYRWRQRHRAGSCKGAGNKRGISHPGRQKCGKSKKNP